MGKIATKPLSVVVELEESLVQVSLLPQMVLHIMGSQKFTVGEKFAAVSRADTRSDIFTSQHTQFDPAVLPYQPAVTEIMRAASAEGRPVYLVTRFGREIADSVLSHLGLDAQAVAVRPGPQPFRLRAASAILDLMESQSFDFVGSEAVGLSLVGSAQNAFLVRPSPRYGRLGEKDGTTIISLVPRIQAIVPLLKSIRPHQWVKNGLLFVPLFFSFSATLEVFADVFIGFLLFSLTASAIYLLNDVLDVSRDQRHPSKRLRPLAAGELRVSTALSFAAVLAVFAVLASAVLLSWRFAAVVMVYVILAIVYNLVLKHKAGADLIGLSTLYTLRLVAGAVAGNLGLSNWLLAFSIFVFLSLAAAKRVGEIMSAVARLHEQTIKDRGYILTDSQTLSIAGIGSGLVSILVVGLFIDEVSQTGGYASPLLLWLFVPLWAYWIIRFWISVARGEVEADPVIHVLKDWVSTTVMACGAAIVVIARLVHL